jgi:glycosyltransferase involved in cell wall biosynthesis
MASAILKQEAELHESSRAVTTVSPSLLSGRVTHERKVHVITNGFDPEEMASIEPYEFGHFAIVYAGTFYSPKRVITPFMAALKRLQDVDHLGHWRFHYYGRSRP